MSKDSGRNRVNPNPTLGDIEQKIAEAVEAMAMPESIRRYINAWSSGLHGISHLYVEVPDSASDREKVLTWLEAHGFDSTDSGIWRTPLEVKVEFRDLESAKAYAVQRDGYLWTDSEGRIVWFSVAYDSKRMSAETDDLPHKWGSLSRVRFSLEDFTAENPEHFREGSAVYLGEEQRKPR